MSARVSRRLATLALTGAFLLASSCTGENPRISKADYDDSCSTQSDCTLAWAGDVCTCDNVVAINAGAEGDFESERSSLQEDCSSIPDCSSSEQRWRPVCNAGTCAVDRRSPDDAGDTSGDDTSSGDADTGEVPDATDTGGSPDTTDTGSTDDTGDTSGGGDTADASDTANSEDGSLLDTVGLDVQVDSL